MRCDDNISYTSSLLLLLLTSVVQHLCDAGPSSAPLSRPLNRQLQGSQQPGNIKREIPDLSSQLLTMQCPTSCVFGSNITRYVLTIELFINYISGINIELSFKYLLLVCCAMFQIYIMAPNTLRCMLTNLTIWKVEVSIRSSKIVS